MPRYSKLQLQVLSLYKQFLRETKGKPGFGSHIRSEFRKNSKIPKNDIMKIEYVFRQGQRKLEMIKSSSISGMGVFERDENDK